MKRGARTVESNKDKEIKYTANLYDKMKEMVWVKGNCDPWYADAKGNVTALWPWTCTAYWWKTRKLDVSAFEFK